MRCRYENTKAIEELKEGFTFAYLQRIAEQSVL
jgi:hypothetical protein